MGVGTVFHYLGSGLLFIAMLMTVVIDISAPVVGQISFLQVDDGGRRARFGALGYCTSGTFGSNGCSDAQIGYNPADVLERVTDADFSNIRSDSTAALTNAFVLHYVGTGITFIAFLLSLPASSTVLGIVATLACFVAFIINVVAAAIDWVVFTLLRREVNKTSANAKYAPAIYLSVVAAALTLIATILMFVTCCAGRRKRRARESRKAMSAY